MRRNLTVLMAAAVCILGSQESCASERTGSMNEERKGIPTILDTDIGGDIDDTWALALLLKCPELDIKMVVADTGDTAYRAKIIAKMLEVANRTDIPVGMGPSFDTHNHTPQEGWVKDYDLDAYPGEVYEDGVDAMIKTIMDSPEPVTLVCIGPVPNIGEALRREPRIAERSCFVGMHGSVFKGYNGADQPCKECNVVNHTPDCQAAFEAAWDITITPLDTCGLVVLDGEIYQEVRHCQDPVVKALMENYRHWLEAQKRVKVLDERSSTLFDTVAVVLAFTDRFFVMEDLPIRVTDDGMTVVDEKARRMKVAVDWKDMDAFERFIVERLTD